MAKVSTRKRGSSWYYAFEAVTPAGKRRRVERGGFATKTEAMDAGAKAQGKYLHGDISMVSDKATVSEFLDEWLEMKGKEVRPLTARNLGVDVARIKKAIGDAQIQKLRPRDIDRMLRGLAAEGLARGTVANVLKTSRAALAYAVYPCELIQTNPAQYVKLPKNLPEKVVERKIISRQGMEELLAACPFGTPCHMPIQIAYHTGMRLGEVLGLCWDCVDLEKGCIKVERQLQYTAAMGSFLCPPKTGSSVRQILVDGQLVGLLKRWKIQQAKNEVAAGKAYLRCYEDADGRLWRISKAQEVPGGYTPRAMVCTRPDGGYVGGRPVNYAMQKAGLNFHSLRHTHATMLMENAAMAKDVAARLGHTSTALTQNLYTHDTEAMQRNTLAIFEELLAKGK